MSDIGEIYKTALENLVAKLRTDSYIVAAVLVGSMAYDTVWERSDIDLVVVTEETRQRQEGICLVECGVNIHCSLVTRSQFRKMLEGSAQGSFVHSMLGKGLMLFSTDETLTELFEARHQMGERDRAAQVLRMASWVLPCLTKAQKWFHVKKDYDYCFLWLMKCVDPLASVELLMHGEVPTREVIQRALVHNPELFATIYTRLIRNEPTPELLETALNAITSYLRDRVQEIFGLILDYLREEGEVRSITEIDHHFARTFNISSVDLACEWLADEQFLAKVAVPVRLTVKSRVDVEEAAYYFGGEEEPWR